MRKFKHPLRWVAVAAFLPPVALWLWLVWLPNVTTRVADAGVFVDANVAPGGTFSNTTSSVHTSLGTFAVYGNYSALRGQPMVAKDTTHDGLVLCVSGKPDTCSKLADGYDDPMRVAAAAPLGLSYDIRRALNYLGIYWVLIGSVVLMVTSVARDAEGSDESPPGG